MAARAATINDPYIRVSHPRDTPEIFAIRVDGLLVCGQECQAKPLRCEAPACGGTRLVDKSEAPGTTAGVQDRDQQ
jgi:hypothetical protein